MIAETLHALHEEIATLAQGRDVKLMAVSKLHPYEEIMEAYNAGQRLFGENHVQEIEEKFPAVRPTGMELHLIGHLQSNKVKKVVPLVDAIDSVDSLKLLKKIDAECASISKTMPVLLEINTSGEETKSGYTDKATLEETVALLPSLKHVHVTGLMTVGPLGGDSEKLRSAFHQLSALRDSLLAEHPSLDLSVLSMGMSDDYPIAISEGSTLVRIGTKIFGKRDYSK